MASTPRHFFAKLSYLAAVVWTSWGVAMSTLSVDRVVSDQSETTRKQQLVLAIKAALVNISGSRQVLKQPELNKLLAQADDYQLSYRYHADHTNNAVDRAQHLIIQFNRAALKQWLIDHQAPVWQQPRPLTLILVNIDNGQDSHWLNTNDQAVSAAILTQCTQRGIRCLQPQMDLNDQLLLQHAITSEPARQQLMQAYQAEQYALIQLQSIGTHSWQAQQLDDQENHPQCFASTPAQAISLAIDQLADEQAEAKQQPNHQPLFLRIEHLTQWQDLSWLIQRLKQNQYLGNLHVAELDQHAAILAMNGQYSSQQWVNWLQIHCKRLSPLNHTDTTITATWQPTPHPADPS